MTDYEKLLVLVHNDPLYEADCIVLLEGDGYARIEHAARLYQNGYAPRVVFSGGVDNLGYGSFSYSLCKPRMIEAGIPENVIIPELRSQHTAEQAHYVIEMARDSGWQRLILVATPHHQCRAYLTFLKAAGCDFVIMNSSAPVERWFYNEGWGSRFDLLEQEDKRIAVYSAKGDLVSVSEALQYQVWKEQQLLGRPVK